MPSKHRFAPPSSMRASPAHQTFVIAVMGMTGAGKSTFISKIAQDYVPTGESQKSCTKDVIPYRCRVAGHDVVMVDTPGFDDDTMSDIEVLEKIGNFLKAQIVDNVQLTGLVYLHDIRTPRWKGTNGRNLRMFTNLCGTNNMRNVILGTTNWDRDGDRRLWEKWEAENRKGATSFGMLENRGAVYRRLHNMKQDVEQIVLDLVQLSPIWTEMQEEMRHGKSILETRAAEEVNHKLDQRVKLQQEELQKLKTELKDAQKRGDQKEREFYAQDMAKIQRELDSIRRLGEERAEKYEKEKEAAAKRHQEEVAALRKTLEDKERAQEQQMLVARVAKKTEEPQQKKINIETDEETFLLAKKLYQNYCAAKKQEEQAARLEQARVEQMKQQQQAQAEKLRQQEEQQVIAQQNQTNMNNLSVMMGMMAMGTMIQTFKDGVCLQSWTCAYPDCNWATLGTKYQAQQGWTCAYCSRRSVLPS